MSIEDDIRTNYPSLAFLSSDPEVGGLLRQAVDPNVGFSPATFQSKLYETSYFRSRSQKQREYDIIANTDPGELAYRRQAFSQAYNQFSQKLGFNIDPGVRDFINVQAMRQGETPDDPTYQAGIATWLHQHPESISWGGTIAAVGNQIGSLARESYLVPMSSDLANHWAIDLQFGQQTEDALKHGLAMAAAGTYPHLADRIMNGETMQQIVEPYRQLISDELGIAPATINMMEHKWSALYDYNFGEQNGGRRIMTMSEATYYVRNRPEFWAGQKGKAMAAEMANRIAGMFGRRA